MKIPEIEQLRGLNIYEVGEISKSFTEEMNRIGDEFRLAQKRSSIVDSIIKSLLNGDDFIFADKNMTTSIEDELKDAGYIVETNTDEKGEITCIDIYFKKK